MDLSPEEEQLLAQMTADWGLPSEATERVKGTFAFHAAVLSHRMRQLCRDVMAGFRREYRN